jgi:DNA polymerase-3 subunit epsilon
MVNFKWAIKEFKRGAVFVSFDVETTGLSPARDRIAEIGAVKFNTGGVIDNFATLVDPGIPMPDAAAKVNNITDSMLKGQPFVEDVMPQFLEFIEGAIIVAHNAPFDCGFINESLARLYKSHLVPFRFLPNKITDTLVMSRSLLPGRKHYNLQALAAGFEIRAENAHRAADDARLCMEIFKQLASAAVIR